MAKSCSVLANRAAPPIFRANAIAKQSDREIARQHLSFAAALTSLRVFSILKYPDSKSLLTLLLDSAHPSFLQRMYQSSVTASSVVQASTASFSKACFSFCPGASQYISSIRALVSTANFPFKSCLVNFSFPLQFFDCFFCSRHGLASFLE